MLLGDLDGLDGLDDVGLVERNYCSSGAWLAWIDWSLACIGLAYALFMLHENPSKGLRMNLSKMTGEELELFLDGLPQSEVDDLDVPAFIRNRQE